LACHREETRKLYKWRGIISNVRVTLIS
jgi:hypothetical protein